MKEGKILSLWIFLLFSEDFKNLKSTTCSQRFIHKCSARRVTELIENKQKRSHELSKTVFILELKRAWSHGIV